MQKRFIILRAEGKAYRHLEAMAHNLCVTLKGMGHSATRVDDKGVYDLAVAIGGDGTMMHTMSAYSKRGIPTIGLNGGGVGFLTSAEVSGIEAFAERVGSGAYEVEERKALEIVHNGRTLGPFVNDVVLKHPSSVATYQLHLNGESLLPPFTADGVIVSTQTGSSGYNIASGGPVVLAKTPVNVVSFIQPLRISLRPLVFSHLSDGGVLTIKVIASKRNRPVSITGDGVPFGTREGFARYGLAEGDAILVRASGTSALFASFGFTSQMHALFEKKGLAK
jgi:NAD kinase